MAELSDDLIVDILLRLPVKSLLRFRSVSKRWCALIDSNNFVKLHLNHSIITKTNQTLIFQSCFNIYSMGLYLLDQAVELVKPINPDQISTRLVGSCNGLLCLLYKCLDYTIIVLWNPATRKHVKLPAIKSSLDLATLTSVVMTSSSYGFGYDSVTDDYKLVMLLQFFFKDYSFRSETNVYSLRSNSWRIIVGVPEYSLRSETNVGAVTCGAIHWVAAKRGSASESCLIVAFDLATEDYKLVTLPDLPKEKVLSFIVSELGGCLSITCSYYKGGVVDVWVMKRYGVRESWTKLLTLSGSEIIKPVYHAIPLAYSMSGDEVLLTLNSRTLLWYNLEKKTVKFVDVHGLSPFCHPMICVESLVSLGDKAKMTRSKVKRMKEQKKSGNKRISLGALGLV